MQPERPCAAHSAGKSLAAFCASSAYGIRVSTASAPACLRVLKALSILLSLVPGQGVKINRPGRLGMLRTSNGWDMLSDPEN